VRVRVRVSGVRIYVLAYRLAGQIDDRPSTVCFNYIVAQEGMDGWHVCGMRTCVDGCMGGWMDASTDGRQAGTHTDTTYP